MLFSYGFVDASDRAKEPASKRDLRQLTGLLEDGGDPSFLVSTHHKSIQSQHKLRSTTNLSRELSSLHLLVLLVRRKSHLALQGVAQDIAPPHPIVTCCRLGTRHVLLQVLGDVVKLHSKVQLADVLFELLGPEEHAEEESRVNVRKSSVVHSLGTYHIVSLPELRIAQDLVGLRKFLELLTGLRVICVLVWVKTQSRLVVGLLEVCGGRIGLGTNGIVQLRVSHLARRPAIWATHLVI
mmetsp:Transcript_101069/g.182400  ORF Transcript_101069/g.182400 Transcript_101069/m.182400 type:complete len:239 (-) Transcript_101069:1606-2322(-)